MKKSIIFALTLLCAVCLFAACAKGSGESARELKISESSVTLEVGESFILSAESDRAVTFSSEGNVVFITAYDKSANITALRSGTATVTVTSGNQTKTCEVTVNENAASNENEGLFISYRDTLDMVLGLTTPVQLTPELRFDGQPTEGTFTYSSENESVATVSAEGIVTAVGEGTTVIRIRAEKDGQTAEKAVGVTVRINGDFILEEDEYLLFLDGTNTVTPVYSAYDGTSAVASPEGVTVTSSDESVFTVSGGTLTGVGVGVAEVEFSWRGLTDTATVRVFRRQVDVASVEDLKAVSSENYYRLTADLSYTFAGISALDEKLIASLDTVLDGNGHKVTLSASAGMTDPNGYHTPNMNFIGTITENGILRNMCIEYTLTSTSNVSGTPTMVIGSNAGVVTDVEATINYSSWYINPADNIAYLSGGGGGTFDSLVLNINATGGWQQYDATAEGCFQIVRSGIVSNLLVVSDTYLTMPSSTSNVVKINKAADFATSGFSVLDFDIGEPHSMWTQTAMFGIPTFISNVPEITETIEINSLEDLTKNADRTDVSFELNTDLEITVDTSDRTAKVIQELNGVFNGNGHTITMNVEGPTQDEMPKDYPGNNFIGTVGEYAEVKDLRIEYFHKSHANGYGGSLIFGTMNGYVHDMEIVANHTNYWQEGVLGILAVNGSGKYENIVLTATGGMGQDGKFNLANDTAVFENVLVLEEAGNFVSMPAATSCTNVVKTAPADYADSGFDASKLDSQYWTVKEGEIPEFNEYTPEISETVTIDSQEKFAQYAGREDVNFELATDLTFTFDGSDLSESALAVLNGYFDGQGHTVTINATAGAADPGTEHSPYLNFINTVSEYGEVKNLRIVYNLTATSNVGYGNGVFSTVDGYVHNVEIEYNYGAHWINGAMRILAGDGTGMFEDVVVAVSGLTQTTKENTLVTAESASSFTFANILVVGTGVTDSDAVPVGMPQGTNVVKTSAAEYTLSEFDDSSFKTDESGSLWTKTALGVPTFASNRPAITETVEIDELADLTSNAGRTDVNFSLNTDLEITFDGSDLGAAVLPLLNGTFDGNGHTVTITATAGSADNASAVNNPYMYFIEEVGVFAAVKNLQIVYDLTSLSNSNNGAMVFGTLNGLAEDIEAHLSYTAYWLENDFRFLANDGNGMFRNTVVYIGGSIPTGKATLRLAYDSVGMENVILITSLASMQAPAGNNTVKAASFAEISGFDRTPFNAGGEDSAWSETALGVLTLKGNSPAITETVEIDELADLTNNASRADVNFSLNTDLTITFDGDGSAVTLPLLNGTFDGNGHKITINASNGGATPYNYLISEISAFGTLKNVRIEYNLTTAENTVGGGMLVGKNDGLIENVEVEFNYVCFYVQGRQTFLTAEGTGVVRNAVVHILGSGWQLSATEGGDAGKIWLSNGSALENVLVVTEFAGISMSEGTNVVKTTAGSFSTGDFDTAPFDIDGENSVWTKLAIGIPTFKENRPVAIIETIEINSLADLTNNASRTDVNFNLNVDLEISLTRTATSTQKVLEVLNGVFNGNGHKITITATGPTQAETGAAGLQDTATNQFIGTVSEFGEVKNLRISYSHISLANGYGGSLVFGTMNGYVHDVELAVSHTNYWQEGSLGVLGLDGTGKYENIVLTATGGMAPVEKFYLANDAATFENVLVVMQPNNDLTMPGETASCTNVVKTAQDSYAASGFDASKLNAEFWNVAEGVIPTLKAAA